jgi:ADP-heptose:LPS heptosyltransferase
MDNILLLQLNRLGDLVQTLPLLRRLREQYPSAQITLVCQAGVHAIVAGLEHFDRLIAIPTNALDILTDPEKAEIFPNLEPFNQFPEFRESFDLAINITSDLGSAVLLERIQAREKLGRIHTFAGELRLLGPWSKYLFAMVANRKDNLFNIVDIQIGMAGLQPRPVPASLPISEPRQSEAKALLDSHGRRGERCLIAIQTGASQLQRAWELENFAELSRRLLERGDTDILLLGDATERERSETLLSLIGLPVLDLVGHTSLVQLPALLAACDLLISNDTGTIHIAAAVGTPTLGLFFSTAYFSETAPYGAGHAVLQVEIPCSPCNASERCPVQTCRTFLPVDAVFETAKWLLDKASEVPMKRPNLSLYLSRFLSNGTMIYLPVHEKASSHFLAGLFGRLLWEGTLDIDRDTELELIWNRIRSHEDWVPLQLKMSKSLEALVVPFTLGLNLATRLCSEFSAEDPVKERIAILHQQMAGLGEDLAASSKEGGLFGDFLIYEMMDLDYATYPSLANILEDKYQRLFDLTTRFQATLARLSKP